MTRAPVPGGELPVDVARERIEARRDLNAFVALTTSREPGAPVAVKDLLDVRGMVTTGGGPAESGRAAVRDADAVAHIRRAGAAIVGKTNLFEWGYGVSSVNRHHGTVPNPRHPERSAGGSSSGSAAAVAAELCAWAVGTDTAGSTRIPAACCGIVGFKPTWGMISTVGVQPLSPSQDTVGALARSVRVAAHAAFTMAGRTLPARPHHEAAPGPPRLAAPAGWVEGLDEPTAAAWRAVAAGLPEIAFPDRRRLFELAEVVQFHEAAHVHDAALVVDPDRFRPEVRARLEHGRTIRAAQARQAREQLDALAEQADRALREWDALLLPATACVAPPLGDEEVREPLTRFTRPFNGTGQPALVLPLPVDGLPVGLQVVGRRGDDERLVAVAQRIERALALDGRLTEEAPA